MMDKDQEIEMLQEENYMLKSKLETCRDVLNRKIQAMSMKSATVERLKADLVKANTLLINERVRRREAEDKLKGV